MSKGLRKCTSKELGGSRLYSVLSPQSSVLSPRPSSIMPRYHFQTPDVFTDTRFGGNPLAVVPVADGWIKAG